MNELNLAQTYAGIHSAAAPRLFRGVHSPDLIPLEADPRWGLSFVVTPPDPLAARLADAAARLRKVAQTAHVIHPSNSIHVTVRSLEGFQESIASRTIEHYLARGREAAAGATDLEIRFHGVVAAGSGVVACGYPNNAMAPIREHLQRQAIKDGAIAWPSGDATRIRNTAHASMLVFREPSVPEQQLVEAITRMNDLDFGSLRVREMHLVRYRVLAEAIHVERLGSVTW